VASRLASVSTRNHKVWDIGGETRRMGSRVSWTGPRSLETGRAPALSGILAQSMRVHDGDARAGRGKKVPGPRGARDQSESGCQCCRQPRVHLTNPGRSRAQGLLLVGNGQAGAGAALRAAGLLAAVLRAAGFLAVAFFAAGVLAAGLPAGACLAAGLRAVAFLAAVFSAAGLRAVVFLAAAFLAAGLRAVVFLAAVFLAADLRAVVFLAAVFFAAGLRAVVFLAAVFLAAG